MRLLYIGTFTGRHVSDWYRLASFKRQFDTEIFDYRTASANIDLTNYLLQETIIRYAPDIVFINKGETIMPTIISRMKRLFPKIFFAAFNGDQRGRPSYETTRLGVVCDRVLINNSDASLWEQYDNWGVNKHKIVEYHTASDADVFKPIKSSRIIYDVVFFGGNYIDRFPLSRFRLDCIKALANHYSVAVCGTQNWSGMNKIHYLGCAYGKEFSSIVGQSRSVLGINAFDNVNRYTSNRTWISMSCGKPYLCHRYAGIEDFFKHKENILIFKDVDQLLRLMDTIIMKDDKLCQRIGEAARDLIVKQHTYDNRTNQLIEIYKEWSNEKC